MTTYNQKFNKGINWAQILVAAVTATCGAIFQKLRGEVRKRPNTGMNPALRYHSARLLNRRIRHV